MAGIGIAFGMCVGDQFSIPVDDTLDPGGKRTNQRAELLAALEGLKKFCDHSDEWMEEQGSSKPVVIITTDSEYVVKGMAEWLPHWKVGIQNTFLRSGQFDVLTPTHVFPHQETRSAEGKRPTALES